MGSFETEEMANYWVDAIRKNKDTVRNYVSNPALFNRLSTLKSWAKSSRLRLRGRLCFKMVDPKRS